MDKSLENWIVQTHRYSVATMVPFTVLICALVWRYLVASVNITKACISVVCFAYMQWRINAEGGIRRMSLLPSHTEFFYEKNLQAQCMDVWCETICSRMHQNTRFSFWKFKNFSHTHPSHSAPTAAVVLPTPSPVILSQFSGHCC